MEVNFNTANYQNKNNNNQYKFPSFKMKMNELKGVDQFVARKYKINPQPIKTLKEFQDKCMNFVEDIVKKAEDGGFSGRRQETQIQRKAMIKDWYEYITKENGAYTGAMALMIIGGITAGLKPKEDTLPPVLNKGVLANTIDEINRNVPENPDNNAVSFDKKYRLNFQKTLMSEEKALDESLNGWIVIPSKVHDPENFEANVDKLKMLSHDNWCTKSFNAEPYLSEGDFHVHMENGKPALGVRFVDDEIEEIQGEKNNSEIPVKYYDVIAPYLNKYKLSNNAQYEKEKLEEIKKQVDKILDKFPEGVNNYSPKEIFENFGIECKVNEDGSYKLSHYDAKCCGGLTYDDLGIDEKRLFENVKRIEGDANFTGTTLTSLGELEFIGGSVFFENSKITSLGKLKAIGKNAYFSGSQVRDFGDLESIAGFYNFNWYDSNLKQECKNRIKDNNNSMVDKILEKFPNGINNYPAEDILESFDIKCKKDKDGLLTISDYKAYIGDIGVNDVTFADLGVDENRLFKYIRKIEGDGIFTCSKVTQLGSLESIGGRAMFNEELEDLGNLKSIGGNADFSMTNVKSLENLESIGGDVLIVAYSKLTPDDFANVNVGGEIIL